MSAPAISTLRHRAAKLGYRIISSRTRRDTIDNFGGYMIVETLRNICVAGDRYDLAIEAVADWLDQEEREAA
jgi:hypothetical protein